MADSKITALTSIGTSTDPVLDQMVIVDVSDGSMAATGTTKKVTVNGLLSTSPTATGAFTVTGALSAGSATITGDLTVRTNKLAVTSTGVGIGTATPNASYILDLTTANDARARQWVADSSFIGSGNLANGFTIRTLSGTTDGVRFLNYAQTTEFMRLDSSGNLGLGVTPSAWSSGMKVFEFGTKGGLAASGGDVNLIYNAYYDGSNKYRTSDYANNFQITGGAFKWLTAPSGTAGNAITYTQAMTLDASGNLLVGTTIGSQKLTVKDNIGLSAITATAADDRLVFSENMPAANLGSQIVWKNSGNGNAYASIGFTNGAAGNNGAIILSTSSSIFGSNNVERMRIKPNGQVRFVPLAADPAGAEAGDVYYNSSSNKLKCYNGTTWNDLF